MDIGFGSPLLEMFRRGDVPRDVRLLAASGALAPRAHEQLALLIALVEDPDPEVAATADTTLRAIPADTLAGFLARSDVPEGMRTFLMARGVAVAETAAGVADAPLLEAEVDESEPEAERNLPTMQRLAAMSVAQRVVRAMRGSREERAILIRDSSKLVSIAVLSSPKMSDSEVESIARMTNVSEEVLRTIARSRAWMKSYTVTLGLAKNPKTPVALSLNLLPQLLEHDLKAISTNRNVPDVLRTAARRKVVGK